MVLRMSALLLPASPITAARRDAGIEFSLRRTLTISTACDSEARR
jgi:hypothetical protein